MKKQPWNNQHKYAKSNQRNKSISQQHHQHRRNYSSMVFNSDYRGVDVENSNYKRKNHNALMNTKYKTYLQLIKKNKIMDKEQFIPVMNKHLIDEVVTGRKTKLSTKNNKVKNIQIHGRKSYNEMFNSQMPSPNSKLPSPTSKVKSPTPLCKSILQQVCRNVRQTKKNTNSQSPQIQKKSQLAIKGGKIGQKQYNKLKDNKNILMSNRNSVKMKNEKYVNEVTIKSSIDEDQQNYEQGIQFYRDLGKGAHALVRSAVDWNNKRKIAVKIYNKKELTAEQISSIECEIEILTAVKHNNLIKLYEIIETYKTVHKFLEYGGGNSLQQYIMSNPKGKLDEKQTKFIFKQILQAVNYMHINHIAHRDIKTENILLNKHLQLKIIDFGFSLICGSDEIIRSYCGTPTHMPPQVVSKTAHNPQLADLWSLGVLLFNMLNGRVPFKAKTQKQLFSKICQVDYHYEFDINPLAKQLIQNFLKKNPNKRMKTFQALQFQWIKQNMI